MNFITLKNGVKIKPEWSFNTTLLLDEYEGGVEAFEKDYQNRRTSLRAYGHLVYAIIASNVDEVLSPRQAQRLIDDSQIENINNFLKYNQNKIDAFQKKQKSSSTTTHKKNKNKQTSPK